MRPSAAARVYLPGNTRNVWWSGALWPRSPRTRNGVAATPAIADARCGQDGGLQKPAGTLDSAVKAGAGRKGRERPWRDGNVRITPPPGVSFANCCLMMRWLAGLAWAAIH